MRSSSSRPLGLGKSSLAFDTIFAEGQRRYVESLSAYARQFLGQVDRPDVDFIEGLSPAVSIDQKSTNRNPRSTVGTITEIHDYMRLLWARIGVPHCPECGAVIQRQTVQQIADQLLELPERTRYQIVAPVVTQKKGEFVDLFKELSAKGYARAVVDGELVQLAEPPVLKKSYKHDIAVVVDRLVASGDILGRVTDSVETALGLAGGIMQVNFVDEEGDAAWQSFSEKLACPNGHPLQLTEIEPRTFSFNAPFGACPACSGLGTRMSVDVELMLGDEDLSIRDGVLVPWTTQGKGLFQYYERLLEGLADDLGFSLDTPWRKLPRDVQEAVLHGDNFKVNVRWKNRYGREMRYTSGFEGSCPTSSASSFRPSPTRSASVGGVPPRGAVPRVRRRSPPPRGARRQGARLLDRGRRAPEPDRGPRVLRRARAERAGGRDRGRRAP